MNLLRMALFAAHPYELLAFGMALGIVVGMGVCWLAQSARCVPELVK